MNEKEKFIIDDYQKKPTFASFLPGISGKKGIPIWSFYVNRGQGICSFGTEDKEHSIMEFYPAPQAYQNTETLGFRTFLKVDGVYYEPFSNTKNCTTQMIIGRNDLEIRECNHELEIEIRVVYHTLSMQHTGALVRHLTIINQKEQDREVELLDGMPAVIPYGVSLTNLKEMAQTVKAWMMVEDVAEKKPYFKVRASIKDSTEVTKTEAGNFYITICEDGLVDAIVDSEALFSYDTSFKNPLMFQKNQVEELLKTKQITNNQIPCAFFGKKFRIYACNKSDFYGIVGHVKNKEERDLIIKKCLQKDFLVENKKESDAILEEICQVIETKTGNDKFDAYCKQTYLDNVLRGGFPIQIASNKVFYVYGRKHGDIERDYNFFQMQPEYYSQGNGNFRDINQNRRCDVAFSPFVGDKNIKTFYNLTQWDGYNPLLIQKTYFQVEDDTFSFLNNKPFSPGSLYAYLEEELDDDKDLIEKQFAQIMEVAVEKQEAEHGEGFWTDHWTYQLDLVEEYLTIFPEKKEALLFEDRTYTCHQGEAYVQPRKKRYVVTERGVRQMHAVKEEKAEILMEEYYFSLFELLLLQVVTKYSCLDPYGLGMEMEAGKPGWYDALNGLPALFGSSMPETLELERLIAFLLDQMTDPERNIKIPGILFLFIKTMVAHDIPLNRNDSRARFSYWDSVNNAKEAYREQLRKGSVGECFNVSMEEIKSWLVAWKEDVEAGTTEAIRLGNGICPTYFYYELSEYEVVGEEILPKQFLRKQMPLFLEGPVRYLKLAKSKQDKQAMYQKVKRSPLYDQKLKMYKVNESLADLSFEIGRAKAFTPGWLENESIWLHMEYKYLLELLKSKLYTEFFEAFEQAVIPFLDEETYGRSILENSSFIVSSANENEKLHGRGFVARLSGSTIEFLNMWLIMMFGKTPFQMIDGRFTLTFAPAIPSYLIKEETQIKATFLGDITVCFNVEGLKALIPGCYSITSYTLFYKNGTVKEIEGTTLFENEAYDVREKRISKIEVKISSL